ncbi:hypothetical protein WJX72_012508 [[Myrmecia] bisecta]|uniref:PPM-type phosphatase domain-containing protein n=1 Tax=[Myrmecia] bisecta TaxID=41462 RepID=A0AAW1PHM5_9CHLO
MSSLQSLERSGSYELASSHRSSPIVPDLASIPVFSTLGLLGDRRHQSSSAGAGPESQAPGPSRRPRQLFVANCGDSRAVLCRSGVAIPLTDDHKAAREDETARVEAAGGQILFWNGVRVMGVLAVSRAIGDHCLRPFVIAQPEVTILGRRADDELLLLASDGLWDVLTNQEACSLAKRCLRRARQRGATRQSAARIAATVLTRAAVDRGSRDNVTVVVIDLSSAAEPETISRTPSSALTDDMMSDSASDAPEGAASRRVSSDTTSSNTLASSASHQSRTSRPS